MQNNKLNDERYVLNKKEKEQRHVIKEVYPDSIAEELEIEAGDVLLAINDQAIQDVFDYRYLIKNEYIEVLVEKQDGSPSYDSTKTLKWVEKVLLLLFKHGKNLVKIL